jgi:hypothetical protein
MAVHSSASVKAAKVAYFGSPRAKASTSGLVMRCRSAQRSATFWASGPAATGMDRTLSRTANQALEAPSRIVRTGWSQPVLNDARCGCRPRQRGSRPLASSPNAWAIRRGVLQVRQRTWTSAASPLTPISRSSSTGPEQLGPWWTNSTHGKSSR